MTLSILSFVVFLDPHQGIDGVCLSLKIFGIYGMRHSNIAFSLTLLLIRFLLSGAYRWEIEYTYLQDIYCIVKLWIHRNKS